MKNIKCYEVKISFSWNSQAYQNTEMKTAIFKITPEYFSL